MKTVIDLSETELEALDALAQSRKVSREALIRKAVTTLLDAKPVDRDADGFGLWGNEPIDGLAYQEKLRREW